MRAALRHREGLLEGKGRGGKQFPLPASGAFEPQDTPYYAAFVVCTHDVFFFLPGSVRGDVRKKTFVTYGQVIIGPATNIRKARGNKYRRKKGRHFVENSTSGIIILIGDILWMGVEVV